MKETGRNREGKENENRKGEIVIIFNARWDGNQYHSSAKHDCNNCLKDKREGKNEERKEEKRKEIKI